MPRVIEGVRYVTVSEAAAMLGVGACVMRRYAAQGRLAGAWRVGLWMLPVRSVKAFASVPRPRGRPTKG
jgi:hypothetical protein